MVVDTENVDKKIDPDGDPGKLWLRGYIRPVESRIRELLAKEPFYWSDGEILYIKNVIGENERSKRPACFMENTYGEKNMDVFLIKHYFSADDIIERMSFQRECDVAELNRRASRIGTLEYEAKVLRNRLKKLGGKTEVGDIWDTKGSLD